MPTSSRYSELQKAVRKFRRALLPGRFDPTGTYRSADRVHLRTISFRIMVHAEIEAYLEDRAYELLNAAWNEWLARRVPSDVMLGLLAYGGFETHLPPKKLTGGNQQLAYADLHFAIHKAQGVWRNCHTNNHGIKEEHVLALILPLGIKHTDLDTTLLADLSSYGSDRGEVAHKSNATIKQYADPKSELDKATKLVADLQKLDQIISNALHRIGKVAAAI